MQYLNVFICLIFLLKQFCVDIFRKQFQGTLILTYLQWSLDPTFLARSVNSLDLIFISLSQLLYTSLRFGGENLVFIKTKVSVYMHQFNWPRLYIVYFQSFKNVQISKLDKLL